MADKATGRKKVTIADRFRHNKAALVALIVLVIMFAAIFGANFVSPYDPAQSSLRGRLVGPSFTPLEEGATPHYLGTDQLGRDTFSRLLHGGQVSLNVGFTVATIGAIIGIILGMFAGYFGGWTDMIIMRLVDIWSSSPTLLIALTFVMILGPGQRNLIIALHHGIHVILNLTLFSQCPTTYPGSNRFEHTDLALHGTINLSGIFHCRASIIFPCVQ